MNEAEARDFRPAGGGAWREPWRPVNGEEARHGEEELRRELCLEHVLAGCAVVALGRSDGCDDWLFGVTHPRARFAVVHLTYQRETLPQWPGTRLFADWSELEQECLIPDATAYNT